MPAANHACQLPRIEAGCQLLCALRYLRMPIVLELCGQEPLSEDLGWREVDSGRQRQAGCNIPGCLQSNLKGIYMLALTCH